MDGIHDLGGMAGFGTFEVEAEEPTFHEPWEQTAFQLNLACIGTLRAYNTDEYRHAVERMAPSHYLQARYYERVLTGVTSLLIEKGVVHAADLEARAGGRVPLAQPIATNEADGREQPQAPRFNVGDTVRVRKIDAPGHTRVPRYVRGHLGVVVHVAPPFKFPDAHAHGLPTRRECTYHVEFAANALWPESTPMDDRVIVDLWESYLEKVQ